MYITAALCCCGYHYSTISFSQAWTQVLGRFRESLKMVSAGDKAKNLLLVNHSAQKNPFTYVFAPSVFNEIYFTRFKMTSWVTPQPCLKFQSYMIPNADPNAFFFVGLDYETFYRGMYTNKVFWQSK